MRWMLLIALLLLPSLADAKSMYTRPPSACTFNGDGTTHDCAASAGATGAYRAMSGVAWGAGADQVSNGDTLYICGLHDGGNTSPADNNLTPTTNATIDGNCPGDTGSWISANLRLTSGWTGPDAFGAYSQAATGTSSMHIAQLVNGVPVRFPYYKTGVPDATWTQDGTFYHDEVGHVLYVKPIGGVSPNSTTIYTTWTGAITATNVTVTIQNLVLYGLSLDYCIKFTNADYSILKNSTIKWCRNYTVSVNSASDFLLIRYNDFSEAGTGVYFIATTTGGNSNDALMASNNIHDLNQDGYYHDTGPVADNHGFGIQGGSRNLVTDNIITRLAGTCITFYDAAGQEMKNNSIIKNKCQNVAELGSGGRRALGIEYDNTNAGHVANDVVNNLVAGNLITDVTNSCLTTKSVQPSVGLPWYYINNTLVRCGFGLKFRDETDGNIGFVYNNNLCYLCTVNTTHIQNGTDDLTGIVIDYNVWYPDGASSFEWNGAITNFASWKTNSSQDAHSSVTDPLLVGASDYRLSPSSPARLAGTATPYCVGVTGSVCRNPPDIGAYPSTSGSPATTRTARQQYIFQPVASSTFSGGSANPLSEGGVWAVNQSGGGSFQISAAIANPTDLTQDSGARYIGNGFNQNQYSRGNLTITGTAGGGSGIGLEICASSSARTLYRFTIDHNTTTNAFLYRFVAGSGSLLTGGSWLQTFSDGDQFSLANVGETIYVFKGSTLVKRIDDTGGGVGCAATRFPGLAFSSTETSASVDNWSGGNFRLAY